MILKEKKLNIHKVFSKNKIKRNKCESITFVNKRIHLIYVQLKEKKKINFGRVEKTREVILRMDPAVIQFVYLFHL